MSPDWYEEGPALTRMWSVMVILVVVWIALIVWGGITWWNG